MRPTLCARKRKIVSEPFRDRPAQVWSVTGAGAAESRHLPQNPLIPANAGTQMT